MIFKLHHFGFATLSIKKSIESYSLLGFSIINDEYIDNNQEVRIQFIHNGDYLIELIEPIDEKSHLWRILSKRPGLYHMCFIVNDIIKAIDILQSARWKIISQQKQAIAFDNKYVVFMVDPIGSVIELLEDKE